MSKAILYFLILFSTSALARKIDLKYIQENQTIQSTSEILAYLSSDSCAGRNPGSLGFERAVDYVEDFLDEHNFNPYYATYRDSFLVNSTPTFNLIATLNRNKKSDKYIILSAHLDHLKQSKYLKSDPIFNGANDNASGVTAVLQIAKFLNKFKFKDNVMLILFSAEEEGLIGSKHLSKRFQKEDVSIKYLLNFEMIGKTLSNSPKQIYLSGYDKSNLANQMNKFGDSLLAVKLQEAANIGIFYMSDNYPFFKNLGIPSHTLSSFDFKNDDCYHKTCDEFEEIELVNMHSIINRCTLAIYSMLKSRADVFLYKK
jgi:Peptidase family M28